MATHMMALSGMNPEEENPAVNIDGKSYHRKYSDQSEVYAFHKLSSVKKINLPVNKNLLDEYKFFTKHVDQRDHSLVFAR